MEEKFVDIGEMISILLLNLLGLQSLLDLALRTTATAADHLHEDLMCVVEKSSLLKRLGSIKGPEFSHSSSSRNDMEEPISITGLETFSLIYKRF
ncbi:hypothetical protein K1719_028741 [Acacia pycnantha]|nr:hypothetical protein K1719_028741 [Acacia pycnantha]